MTIDADPNRFVAHIRPRLVAGAKADGNTCEALSTALNNLEER